MEKEKLTVDNILKIYFVDGIMTIDVNNENFWREKILNNRNKIIKIESIDWEWNTLTGEVMFK